MNRALKRDLPVAAAMLAAAFAPLGACTNQKTAQPNTSPATVAPGTQSMTTQLKSTDGTTVADATFDFANGYATVTVESGPNRILSPGFHGLHIHSVGECAAAGDFDSAGGHYQAPGHTGYPASGDLTALQVRPDGSSKLVTTTSAFNAADLKSGSGTSLVIHQDPGNLGAGPADEAGKRVACGVIAAPTASSSTTPSVSTVTTTVFVPPPSTSTSTATVTSSPATTVTSAPTVTTTTTPSLPPTNLPPGG